METEKAWARNGAKREARPAVARRTAPSERDCLQRTNMLYEHRPLKVRKREVQWMQTCAMVFEFLVFTAGPNVAANRKTIDGEAGYGPSG